MYWHSLCTWPESSIYRCQWYIHILARVRDVHLRRVYCSHTILGTFCRASVGITGVVSKQTLNYTVPASPNKTATHDVARTAFGQTRDTMNNEQKTFTLSWSPPCAHPPSYIVVYRADDFYEFIKTVI